jgi:hypothetical protein
MIRQTHTFAVLELSEAAYLEISGKLRAAGYEHAFHNDGEIDMHGIAVACAEPELHEPPEEISTGLYRMVDGQEVGNEPETPEM